MSIPAWVIALLAMLFGLLGGPGKRVTTSATSTTTAATYSTTATGAVCVVNEETGFCDVITTNTGN